MEELAAHKERQDSNRRKAGSAWQETGLVFTTTLGTRLDPHNINRSMKRIAEKAKIRHVHPHDARYTNLSQRLKNGDDMAVVAAIAGHANPTITLNLYRTVYEDERRRAVFSLADRRKAFESAKKDDGSQ